MDNQSKTCSCGGNFGATTGLLIISIATLFMLGTQGYVSFQLVDTLWPILLGLIGVIKVAKSTCGCEGDCTCK